MPAIASSPNDFLFAYDPATNQLRGHWPANVDEKSLRSHYADLLAAACAHGNCRYWLLDLRGRNWHTPGFGKWYDSVFAKAAHAALHQPVFIAYVVSAMYNTLANTPGMQATQRGCLPYDVYPFLFTDEAAAHAWLAHQQALSC